MGKTLTARQPVQKPNTILLFDTAVASTNLGDLVIVDAIRSELRSLFPDARTFSAQTHDRIGMETYRLLRRSDRAFVAGTNLLSSNMHRYNQWKVNLLDAPFLSDITLLGVGWWQYQSSPGLYTRLLLKRLLARDGLHAVRDEFSKEMLHAAGISNVVNTGCPTMWKLSPEHCAGIPSEAGRSVVFTLTDYNRKPDLDQALIDGLLAVYDELLFWPQGFGDLVYMRTLRTERTRVLAPSLEALDDALGGRVDYVGTRLHAGIRAMQKSRRSLIVEVDNRAAEIAKDTGLPTVSRDKCRSLSSLLSAPIATDIRLRTDAIDLWRGQFE